MKVAFEEIGRVSATFAHANGEAGQVCKVTANGTIGTCADGDNFCGVIETVRKGFAGVQVAGFAEIGYTGTAPALGYTALAANGSGGVKAASGGRSCLVVSADTAKQTVIIKL